MIVTIYELFISGILAELKRLATHANIKKLFTHNIPEKSGIRYTLPCSCRCTAAYTQMEALLNVSR